MYIADSLAGIANAQNCEVRSIAGGSAENMYMLVSAPNGYQKRCFILKGNPGAWSIQDTVYSYVSNIWLSPSGKLFRARAGVYRQEAGMWRSHLPQLHAEAIGGTSDINVMAVGSSSTFGLRGSVYQYDGVDWVELNDLALSNVMYTDVWVSENSVFIVGWLLGATQKTIVVHAN